MSVEHIGKGYVKICVSEEELENSIAGLSRGLLTQQSWENILIQR